MFPSPCSDLPYKVAVVFSETSRAAHQSAADGAGSLYDFTGAWGCSRTWLKGEYAYLAPNAASTLLNRCHVKHAWLDEKDLAAGVSRDCIALVIANAVALSPESCAAVEAFVARGGRLLVTGRTNLPPAVLGLEGLSYHLPSGFTGWRWRRNSPFGDRAATSYVTGYTGHGVALAAPAPGTRILADLVEFSGDMRARETVSADVLGPAILATERTVYVANPVFEFLGGALQGHLNVEAIRRWTDPIHWGDTIGLFLRRLMLEAGFGSAWETRLRAFSNHNGVVSFRHDVHGQRDFAILDFQVQALVPASYDIEDPEVAEHTRPDEAADWVEKTSGYDFIEQALHNDSAAGDPPVGVHGAGLYALVREGARRLGFPVFTGGRHGGGHMHPETLDAMDYLYANDDRILGLCTFSFYRMIEYGVRDPTVMVRGKAITYESDHYPTISASAFWYPFQPVVTAVDDWRVLRGWDRTHAADSDFGQIDTLFDGPLENGVYSIQYHPQYATDPARNEGRGTLGFVRYAVALAERRNFWVANQRALYQRMADWQAVAFAVDDAAVARLHNPTDRRIAGLAIERRPEFGSLWDGNDELIHIMDGTIVTVPPLAPGGLCELRFAPHATGSPRIIQSNHPGLMVLDARRHASDGTISLRLLICRAQKVQLVSVAPNSIWSVHVDGEPPFSVTASEERGFGRAGRADIRPVDYIVVPVSGPNRRFAERSVKIAPS